MEDRNPEHRPHSQPTPSPTMTPTHFPNLDEIASIPYGVEMPLVLLQATSLDALRLIHHS